MKTIPQCGYQIRWTTNSNAKWLGKSPFRQCTRNGNVEVRPGKYLCWQHNEMLIQQKKEQTKHQQAEEEKQNYANKVKGLSYQ